MASKSFPFEILLNKLGEFSRITIREHLRQLGIRVTKGATKQVSNELIEEFLDLWREKIGPRFYCRSVLSIERQAEIFRHLFKSMDLYRERKRHILKELEENWNKLSGSEKEAKLSKAAWFSINPADSEKGYRLRLGFRNIGCQYWGSADDHIGCYNCRYFMGCLPFAIDYFRPVEQYENYLLSQFENVLEDVKDQKHLEFDTIDIVGGGSFLNVNEVPKTAQVKIFRRIGNMQEIKRILVESRSEFINPDLIEELIGVLRDDQRMEIAIGLEATDTFIRNHCINKGYTLDSFESAIKKLVPFKERCVIQAYVLIKPAFLSETEALVEAVNSVRYLVRLSKRYNYPIYIKCEPTVVSIGTLLDILYDTRKYPDVPKYDPYPKPPQDVMLPQRLYMPPSYWTVAEIIAQLSLDGSHEYIRIGAREDMDMYRAIPAVYDIRGRLSTVDFVLYNAVQNFNSHKDIVTLLYGIQAALVDSSFDEWKNEVDLRNPTLLKLNDDLQDNIAQLIHRKDAEIGFQNKLSSIFHEIQNSDKSCSVFRDIANFWGEIHPEERERRVKEHVLQYIRHEADGISEDEVTITRLSFLKDKDFNYVRFELNITNRKIGKSYDLWIKVPTNNLKDAELKKSKSERREIERKFIIDHIPARLLGKPISIRQAYISISDTEEVRIRKKQKDGGNYDYILTQKSREDKSRAEIEVKISEDTFNDLLDASDKRIIDKDRYEIPAPDGKHRIELDIFKGHLNGLSVAEVEFKTEGESNEFIPPEWFGHEVTFDKRFKNQSLASLGIDSILIPSSVKYAMSGVLLFTDSTEDSVKKTILEGIEVISKKNGVSDVRTLDDFVYQISGEINADVVELLRSAKLVVIDVTQPDLNLLTKFAIRFSSEKPTLLLTMQRGNKLPDTFLVPDGRFGKEERDQLAGVIAHMFARETSQAVLCSFDEGQTLSEMIQSQQIVDNEILSYYEEKAKEIWVVTTTLEFDVGELYEVVHKNLRYGKRYRYYIPPLESNFRYSEILRRNYRKYWEIFGRFRSQIEMKILEEKGPAYFKEIVIYDPLTDPEPFGFTYVDNKSSVDFELIRIPPLLLHSVVYLLGG